MSSFPPSPSGFFNVLYDDYQRAVQTCEVIDKHYRFSIYTFRLRFAGPALIPYLTPALEHLEIPPCSVNPDLTICLWDSNSSGFSGIGKSWAVPAMLQARRGELREYCDERYQTALQTDAGILSMLDKRRNLALGLVQHTFVSVYKQASPCQLILHWWMRDRDLYMIHAAAVGLRQGAALIVGQSGSGKSTSSLACLHAGMKYLADDRCVMSLTPNPYAFALYNSGKVTGNQMQLFPRFQQAVSNPNEHTLEKALIFVQQIAPCQIAPSLPIKVILLAHLTHQSDSTINPVKPMAVCQILASSTMIYAPGWSHSDLHAAAQLVQRVPCYRINLGTDIWQIPKLISQTISYEISRD